MLDTAVVIEFSCRIHCCLPFVLAHSDQLDGGGTKDCVRKYVAYI